MATIHVAKSDDEGDKIILQHETLNSARFVTRKIKKKGVASVSSLNEYRIKFEDHGRNSVQVPYSGVPFIVLSCDMRECMYGPKRKRPEKPLVHDDHAFSTNRRLIQPSRKMGCCAKVKLRRIVSFPEYKIQGCDSKWKRRAISDKLRDEFNNRTSQQYCIFIQFVGNHTNHVSGMAAKYCNPLDKRIIKNIKSQVNDGSMNVDDIQRRSEMFGKELNEQCEATKIDTRFKPKRKDVYNHIYNSVSDSRSNANDQGNVCALVEEWKAEMDSNDSIFFRPMSTDNTMLFVYQSTFQKHLIQRYGNGMCLLDSTYKTTKYTVPLFFVCIPTNIGFQVVASFVVGKETTSLICEALKMISEWNPHWKPENFITDFDQREISALEKVFPGIDVKLCEFHTEQSWQRWLRSKKNGVSQWKEELLKLIRCVARSKSEEAFHENVNTIKSSEAYKASQSFRNWIEKQWLQESKRWVHCYQRSGTNRPVYSTNGVERQHRLLKENYLKKHGFGGTLTSLLTILIRKFFPDMQNRYVQSNISALEASRKYSEYVPEFLKGRPRNFVAHCLDRMPPKVEDIEKSTLVFTDGESCRVSSQSGKVYIVTFTSRVPKCSCPDFEKHLWPCKHILAIFKHFPAYSWETLDIAYTSLPYFNIDNEIINNLEKDKEASVDSEFVNTPLPIQIDKSSKGGNNVNDERKQCVELLKNIQNSIYAVSSRDVMHHVKVKLQELDRFMDDNCVKISGLPTRLKHIKKKKKATSKKVRTNETDCKIIPLDSNLIIDGPQVAEEHDEDHFLLQSEHFPYLEAVEKICMSSSEYQVGKIGPYILTCQSIRNLQTTLSDEVIDSYLHLLIQQCSDNNLHISCVVMTSIFTGQEEVHSLLKREKILEYDHIIGAVNEGSNHWTLIIICPSERKMIYINPLGEVHITEQQLLQRWYAFLHKRFNAKIDSQAPNTWSFESPPHSKQIDGMSCGVYVLMFAERFLRGRSLQFQFNSVHLAEARSAIAARLLHATGQMLSSYEETDSLDTDMNDDTTPAVEEEKITDEDLTESVTYEAHDDSNDEKASVSYPYNLREEPMKKRISSYFYPSVKKRRKFCVCHKKNDGKTSKYRQCDVCQNWYHADCIGVSNSREGENNYCSKNCQVVVISDGEQANDQDRKQPSDSDSEEEFGRHDKQDETLIPFSYINSQWENMTSFLTDISSCNQKHCKEKSHERHHLFNENYANEIRRKHYYGIKYFKTKTVEQLHEQLQNQFMYQMLDPKYPATGLRIQMIRSVQTNSCLYKLFCRNQIISHSYLAYLLLKEALAFIVATYKTISYTEADKSCSETEKDIRDIIPKLKKN